ncbi:MAG: hypothetical protein JSS98_00780 [Bacteroidetes bacterium]|nr:hypothetical protein [Bacteroidota bacterium]
MKLFRRKRNEEKKEAGKDKLAKNIAGFIQKTQNGFARFMSKRTEKLSPSTMKFALIVFLLCGSGLSVFFIVTAFKKNGVLKVINIDRLSVPRYYDKNSDNSMQPGFFITKKEHEEMQAFKNYLDSLRHNKKGIRVYDSIMLNRPGLMDSVNKLEQLYQQQLQNKK